MVGPFAKGPVEIPISIETENDLLTIFGEPYPTDKQYEYWLSASSYLAYGGNMRIVRADDVDLRNSAISSDITSPTDVKIKSLEHYSQLGYDETLIPGIHFVAQNPGSWANGIRVAVIDSFADQEITISTSGLGTTFDSSLVGCGVTQSIQKVSAGIGVTTVLDGYLKGIITGINTVTNKIAIKVLNHIADSGEEYIVDYQENGVWSFEANVNLTIIEKNSETLTSIGSTVPLLKEDWFELQKIGISTFISVNWATIAPRPGTTEYAESRGSRFDELHILVIDGEGQITGNAGTIIEKTYWIIKSN
jgi:hypothetical protein